MTRLLLRLDRALRRLGLMRISQQFIEEFSYDHLSGKIFVRFKGGTPFTNRIVGYVCPTPDGPLKNVVNVSNPLFAPPADSAGEPGGLHV